MNFSTIILLNIFIVSIKAMGYCEYFERQGIHKEGCPLPKSLEPKTTPKRKLEILIDSSSLT